MIEIPTTESSEDHRGPVAEVGPSDSDDLSGHMLEQIHVTAVFNPAKNEHEFAISLSPCKKVLTAMEIGDCENPSICVCRIALGPRPPDDQEESILVRNAKRKQAYDHVVVMEVRSSPDPVIVDVSDVRVMGLDRI
jgi:hypothetical protein